MKHLSPAELVDHAEGTLDPVRAAHADGCARCREASHALRATLSFASDHGPDVPEPSPLFWDHLSARVRQGIAAEPVPAASAWWNPVVRVLAPVTAVAVIVATVTMTVARREDQRLPPAQVAAVPVTTEADRTAEPWNDASTAEVWEVLTAAAADVEWDGAHDMAMGVGPGAIDRAVMQLSGPELNELGRLLQSELKRSSD